ncbi:hypothetical protein HC761_01075 [bacterium]|nr:hypothetical protein [bacterium]
MEASKQSRFDSLYAQHLRALKLQGKAPKTVDGYTRAVRHIAAYFDRCPDQLSIEDLKTYFAHLIDQRSWSLVKITRCGIEPAPPKSSKGFTSFECTTNDPR